jgi:carboxypeptidase Q
MDAGKPQGLLNMSGGWRGQDRGNGAEPLPSAYMVHEHYAMLYRLAGRPAPAHTRVEIELTNKIIPGPITVYNTVGEIPGSEKPDEMVIIGAHLDSWDLAQGTTDNGTGTCCVLETARTLMQAGVKPKRTIRFCLFTGEEEGLHGSREYVKAHKDEMAKISLCLVHDTGTGKVIGLGTQGRESIVPILESELVSLQPLGLAEINRRSLGGSDHQSFESAGVPGFAVQQDMSEYNFTHHSQSDTFDKVHEADLIEGVQVLAVAAVRVANLPNLLPRGDKPEGSGRGGRGGRQFQDSPSGKAAEQKDKAAEKKADDKK